MSALVDLTAALALAVKKYDTPRRDRPRPANGVKESDHELRRRMNWLRERIEQESRKAA